MPNSDSAEEYDVVRPRADCISESLRAFGYTFEAAIADLVDNSISARSKHVKVGFDWNDGAPFLWVIDDGEGMSEEELVEAMRPGTQNPLDHREPNDLGRFGLGLKTASFSQCRRVTVRSRTIGGDVALRTWDLDVIQRHNDWLLSRKATATIQRALEELDDRASGTIVVWENLDRWHSDAEGKDATYRHFAAKMLDVENHLAMTFHRFLGGRSGLAIYVGERNVDAWDPFLSTEKATQELNEERLDYGGTAIFVQPYVLPHISFIGADKHRMARGPKGWNAQQGFYIYRNKRLIIAGDWLGLGYQQEEHHKLARIRVDILNDGDMHWQLDVRKASATPPPTLRPELKRIADVARRIAAAVYRYRGKTVRRQSNVDVDVVWKQVKKRDRTVFKANRQHIVIKDLLAEAGAAGRDLVEILESTLPIDSIIMANAEQPDSVIVDDDYDATAGLEKRALALLRLKIADGMAPGHAYEEVARIEPFDRSPRFLAKAEEYLEQLE